MKIFSSWHLWTYSVDDTAGNLALWPSSHHFGPVEQKGDWNHFIVSGHNILARSRAWACGDLCKRSNSTHEAFSLPQAIWRKKVGQELFPEKLSCSVIYSNLIKKKSEENITNVENVENERFYCFLKNVFPFHAGNIDKKVGRRAAKDWKSCVVLKKHQVA